MMKKSSKSRQVQGGISLIEIMVAMVSALLLTAGVIQIFVANKQTYRVQDELARLQENARYAMHLLVSNLRAAGYSGCVNLDTITPTVMANPPLSNVFNSAGAIIGHDYTGAAWDPVLPATITTALAGTDVVTVQHTNDCGAYLLTSSPPNANIQIPAGNTCNFQAGDALLISDCKSADLFRATTASSSSTTQTIAHGAANNTATPPFLSATYGTDAQVMRFVSESYFVANGTNGDPALWRFNNTVAASATNPVELVEGVESFQVLYGVDTDATPDGAANTYQTADTVDAAANWGRAISVRIFLRMRTGKQVATRPQTYTFMGVTTTPADRYLRREFTTTIRLRNRGLTS